jgi:hypothetical protein
MRKWLDQITLTGEISNVTKDSATDVDKDYKTCNACTTYTNGSQNHDQVQFWGMLTLHQVEEYPLWQL